MHKLKLNKVLFLKIFSAKKNLKIFFLLSLPFLMQFSCNTTEPPTPPVEPIPVLELKLDDTSCTEAWLQLTTKDLTLPAELTLKQYNPTGDSVTQTFSLSTADSLLYIYSLLPNQSYKFKTVLNTTDHPQPTTNLLSVTTMDTTSHNFTFESWTFGTIGSSVLYDVAIINENNIWAVGEIMIADTSQNGYTTYNAVHWNGSTWELLRIPNYDYPNTLVYGALQTIFAFSANDIWFCSYSNLVHYDGNNFSSKAQFMTSINFNGQVIKMWGTDKNNIYCVGRNGAIYRYYGTNWQRIESGTTLNINDIWGDFNEKTQEWEILAVASNKFFNEGSSIMKIENVAIIELSKTGLPWSLSSIFFSSEKKYYVAGDGLFTASIKNEKWIKVENFPSFYKDIVRGTELNNVFVGGSNGLVSHFNGYSWKHYLGSEIPYFTGRFLAGAINKNIIVAAGWQEQKSIVLIGKR